MLTDEKMTLLQYISLLWTRFTPLEERLLSEVRTVLPEVARPIFDAQVSAITNSTRLLKWNEILYYPKRRGKICWEAVPPFPCTDEMELAEVRFKAAGKGFKATLGAIHGHVFDLHIHPGGRQIAFAPWEGTPKSRLLDDPTRQSTSNKRPAVLLPVWNDFLNTHVAGKLKEWDLYTAESAYSVSLESGEYLILADRERDEFILQRMEPPSDQLYYLESHDGTPEPLSKELEEVMKD